ncbi:Na+/H+ antiporter subunit B [bacterium]|nr:Na+/H+ antiporter subunit B [bacterium]
MRSLILQVMTRGLTPLLLLFSVYLLLRGHNSPGGGFAGGLIASSVLVLFALVFGVQETRKALRVSPLSLLVSGLAIAVLSGLVGWFEGGDFLQAWWYGREVEIIHHFGTPLLFDLGVYLTVLGAMLTMVLTLIEEA